MNTKRTASAARRVLLVLGMAAAMLAAGFALRWWPQRILGKQWQQQLASVPDERALEHCERIASLGDQGTRILVGALASPRQPVARSARIVLGQQVERWSAIRDLDRRSQRVSVLVESLAEQVDRFGPATRRFAAELALRVTAWPTSESTDRLELIAQSEKIVSAAAAPQPSGERVSELRPIESIADRRGDFGPNASGQIRIGELTELPGGQLPIGSATVPSLPAAKGSDSRLDEVGGPRRLDQFPEVVPPPREPRPLRVDPTDVRRLQRPRPSDALDEAQSITANVARSVSSADLRTMLWTDVFRQLHSDDMEIVVAAQSELSARGFRSVEFQLGRQLTDPDVAIRLSLARRLLTLRGIDASRWLVELTRDEDADVRLSAFSTLATSRNRKLRDHVLSLGSRDADARIRRVAEQLGRGLKR
ncbi:MAG: HEAT repeat domain-containing protein [Planctomycetes bacterium]|nr:HEAT repeat domain-containing protein [Planctomycetota bacterium]